MKTNLTFISFKIVLPIILVGFANMSIAKVSKSTEYCNSGSSSIECRKIKTITNYKNNGSGDWLKSNDAFQFRTRDGSGCKIRGHLTRGSNSKLTYSSTYANKSGDWSKPGLVVSQVKEGGWDYNLSWEYNCK